MFQTKHQKKSAFYTAIIMVIVMLIMFFAGMQYIDPPKEYGLAINFGTSDVGMGEMEIVDNVQSAPKQETAVQEVIPSSSENIQENVITSNETEAPVIEKKEEPQKELPVKQNPKPKEVVKEIKEKVEEKPSPSETTQNVLSNLFGKKSEGASSESDGEENVTGNKGKVDGDPNAKSYYGNDVSGGDGNYLLRGRRALSKPKKKPTCNEEGIVVVKIVVNAQGKVIFADAGVKGSTNTAACLLKPATEAALATVWNQDGSAPDRQIGYIKYHFVLSE